MQHVTLVGLGAESQTEEAKAAIKAGLLASLDPALLAKLSALEDEGTSVGQFNDKELKAAAEVAVALLALNPDFSDAIFFAKVLTDEVARRARRRNLIIAGSVVGGIALVGAILLIRR